MAQEKGVSSENWKLDDPRPPKGGWAPGAYLCRCRTCGDRFGGDKRAMSCADCAYHPTAAKIIGEIRSAVSDFYFALDNREHYEAARGKAFERIEAALGMSWEQGKELKMREKVARFFPEVKS
jgi:hypothetical protein